MKIFARFQNTHGAALPTLFLIAIALATAGCGRSPNKAEIVTLLEQQRPLHGWRVTDLDTENSPGARADVIRIKFKSTLESIEDLYAPTNGAPGIAVQAAKDLALAQRDLPRINRRRMVQLPPPPPNPGSWVWLDLASPRGSHAVLTGTIQAERRVDRWKLLLETAEFSSRPAGEPLDRYPEGHRLTKAAEQLQPVVRYLAAVKDAAAKSDADYVEATTQLNRRLAQQHFFIGHIRGAAAEHAWFVETEDGRAVKIRNDGGWSIVRDAGFSAEGNRQTLEPTVRLSSSPVNAIRQAGPMLGDPELNLAFDAAKEVWEATMSRQDGTTVEVSLRSVTNDEYEAERGRLAAQERAVEERFRPGTVFSGNVYLGEDVAQRVTLEFIRNQSSATQVLIHDLDDFDAPENCGTQIVTHRWLAGGYPLRVESKRNGLVRFASSERQLKGEASRSNRRYQLQEIRSEDWEKQKADAARERRMVDEILNNASVWRGVINLNGDANEFSLRFRRTTSGFIATLILVGSDIARDFSVDENFNRHINHGCQLQLGSLGRAHGGSPNRGFYGAIDPPWDHVMISVTTAGQLTLFARVSIADVKAVFEPVQ